MTLSDDIISDVSDILTEHGVDVTVYLNPTYTLDDEGYAGTISVGTGTSAKAFIYSDAGEVITSEVEGIDRQLRYRCFLQSSTGTISQKAIVKWNSEYYKIVSIDRNELEDQTVTFYDLLIERIQPQNIVSCDNYISKL